MTNTKHLITKEIISELWLVMTQMYGQSWISTRGLRPDPSGIWLAALADLTEAQIRDGLRALTRTHDDFPPSVQKFRKLCAGVLGKNGPSDAEESYREISAYLEKPLELRDLSTLTPPTRHTYRQLDYWSFTRLTAEEQRKAWGNAYAATQRQIARGEPIDTVPVPTRLEPPQYVPASYETKLRVMQNLRIMLEEP